MGRFGDSKSVSWPSDVNLCQVKLFLSEESPSLIGLNAQDHLQEKAWVNSKGAGSVDQLPPGFDGTNPAYALHNNVSKIPIIKWQCPPKFVFDLVWQVVAGEESKEVECQNQRVMRVLEAVYPRLSAVPPNPSLPTRQEDSHDSDLNTPLVPITPIEEDDAAADTSFSNISGNAAPTSSQSQISAPGVHGLESSSTYNPNPAANCITPCETALGVEPDIIAAASTAVTALMANNIDPDLLIRILRDPNIMKKLGSNQAARTNFHNMPSPLSESISLPAPAEVHFNRTETGVSSLVTSPCQPLQTSVGRPALLSDPHSIHMSEGISLPAPSLVHINRTQTIGSSLVTYPCQSLQSPVGRPGCVVNLRPPPSEPALAARPLGAPVAKDLNYYKSLIQQHGSERPQNPAQLNLNNILRQSQIPVTHPTSRDLQPKSIMKPCIFFNSSKGCRYGAACAYQHDVLSLKHRVDSMPDLQSAKRMKVNK
ncbi:zinc finger CCCH domain-containing protein 6-like [Heracleum sosnowskyi]|uniref:Zinc finger CCCH domain-containing protein 6-like n=1 Tax=Heracleum sosnowskyi TaxID=360622 RepID=A0AAD8IUW1_9APIA|nr:zinc finger CCCH domain-containing protein 6-like [Heracleum sosnowskyi]